MLVGQRERHIEVYRRNGWRWSFDEYASGAYLALESLVVELAVDDWYVDRAASIVSGAAPACAGSLVVEVARGWKEDAETLPWLHVRAQSDEDAGRPRSP